MSKSPVRIGIGGPVGSGKTALVDALKIPRKGGPGVTRSDPLLINNIDLAPHVGASLDVMARDAKMMRGDRPFAFTNLKGGAGLEGGGRVDSAGIAVRASGPRVKAEWTPLWVPAQVRDARSPSVVGRHARLDLTFLYRDGRTVLARAYAEPPFRVGQWFAEGDGVHMILTSSAPGAFGHDHLKQIVRNVPEAELSENDRLRRASPRHTVSMQS